MRHVGVFGPGPTGTGLPVGPGWLLPFGGPPWALPSRAPHVGREPLPGKGHPVNSVGPGLWVFGWLVLACLGGMGCGGGARLAPGCVPMASPALASASDIRPLDAVVGRVLRVHPPLRFVVVDFSLNDPPVPGTRLEVRREGVLVGVLKAGHFRRETTVAADVISGDVAEGDEVRPEIAD